jgi:hypothetical protein
MQPRRLCGVGARKLQLQVQYNFNTHVVRAAAVDKLPTDCITQRSTLTGRFLHALRSRDNAKTRKTYGSHATAKSRPPTATPTRSATARASAPASQPQAGACTAACPHCSRLTLHPKRNQKVETIYFVFQFQTSGLTNANFGRQYITPSQSSAG